MDDINTNIEDDTHHRFMAQTTTHFDWNDRLDATEMTTPLAVFSEDIQQRSLTNHYVALQPSRQHQTRGVCSHINDAVTGCFTCCRCPDKFKDIYYKWFPYGCKEELREQLRIAWPIVGTMSTQYMNTIVSLIFCGHLGTMQLASLALVTTALTQMLQFLSVMVSISFCGHISELMLDSAALASSIINVSGNAVILGLSAACDTLFSQTFGSKNKLKVGVIFQKSLLILWLCCLPCCALLINTEHLLVYLGQDLRVARLSGLYAQIYISCLPAMVVYNVSAKYLQAQSIVIPSLVIGLISNVTNAGCHAVFLFVLDLGIVGAAIAVSITQWIIAILHVLYIVISKVYLATWSGWSRECLYDWWMFVSLALPSLFMICLEWWSFEILVFVVGLLGIQILAGYSVVHNLITFFYMIPLGLSVAGGVRVGNHLGAACPGKALTASRVSVCLAVTLGTCTCIFVLVTREYIPLLFTNNKEVAELASDLLLTVAFIEIFDNFQATASGVIRGMGQQKFGAIINLLVYYGITLPVAVPTVLKTSLGVEGALLGIIIANITQSFVFLIKICITNWEFESEKAQLRAGVAQSISIQSVSRGQNLPNCNGAEDTLSTDTTELVEADHLTLSDTSSHRSVDSISVGSCQCTQSLLKISLLRIAITFSLVIVLIGGVTLKVYLDGLETVIPKCVVINSTSLNETFIWYELNRNTSATLSDLDRTILNMTYVFEQEHSWNQTFVYCSGVIKPLTAGISWPTYNKTWLFNNLHPHIPTKPFG